MADLNLVGAVGIRVRPDARGFRPEAKRQVMSALRGVDGEVELQPTLADESRVRAGVEKLARSLSRDVTLRARVDSKSAKGEADRLARELGRHGDTMFRISADISDAESKLGAVNDRFIDLKRSSGEALRLDSSRLAADAARVEGIVGRLGDAEHELAAARRRYAKEYEALWARGGDATARERKRLEALSGAVEAARVEVESLGRARVEAESAYSAALAKSRSAEASRLRALERAGEAVSRQSGEFDRLTRGLLEARRVEESYHALATGGREKVIETLERQARAGESYVDTLDRIVEAQRRLNGVGGTDFSALREWASRGFRQSSVTKLRVEADTALAEAELQRLERSRVVRVVARVDRAMLNQLEAIRGVATDSRVSAGLRSWTEAISGFGRATAGVGAVSSWNSMLKVGAKNMDALAYSLGFVTTAVGGLGAAVSGSIGSLSSLAVSVGAIAKGAVLLPAAIIGLGGTFAAGKKGVEAFKAALVDGGEALDALRERSVAAADAAVALRDAFVAANDSGLTKFFQELEGQMGRLPGTVKPLADAWERAYVSAGKFFSSALKGVNDWHSRGSMATSLNLVNDAMDNLAGSGEAVVDTLTAMVDVGARYLPGLASDITGVVERYRDFIEASAASGAMDRWIAEAGRQLRGLGATIAGVAGMVGAVGRAARAAGSDGFVSFGAAVQGAADKLSTPLWQRGMSTLFSGAYESLSRMADGFGRLGDSSMVASKSLSSIMSTSGGIVGLFAELIGKTMTHSSALQGLNEMLSDVRSALASSGGLFVSLGDAMGGNARVAGELIKAFAKIGRSIAAFWADGDELTRGLEKAIPVFADFAVSVVNVTHSLAGPIVALVGNLLSAFADLPEPIRQAITALGLLGAAFVLMRRQAAGNIFGGVLSSVPMLGAAFASAERGVSRFGEVWRSASASVSRSGFGSALAASVAGVVPGLRAAEAGVSSFGSRWASTVAQMRGMSLGQVISTASAGMVQAASNVGVRAGSALTQGIQTSLVAGARGLSSAMSGLVGALGGPWGIAITGLVAGFSMFSQSSSRMKAEVGDLRASMTTLGQTTRETFGVVESALSSNSSGWGDWMAEASTNVNRFIESIGISKNTIADWDNALQATGKTNASLAADIVNAGGSWSQYRENLEQAANAIRENGSLSEEQAQRLFGTRDAAELTGSAVDDLRSRWDEQNNALKQAAQAQREQAEAMGLTSRDAKTLGESMQTVTDEMASVAEKGEAAAAGLDAFNGSLNEGRSASSDYYASMDKVKSAIESANEAVSQGADVFGVWTDAAGRTQRGINLTTEAGRNLSDTLTGSWKSAMTMAKQAYDSAPNQAEGLVQANKALSDWRNKIRNQLVEMGVDAKTAEGILDQVAGKPYEAELALTGDLETLAKAREVAKTLDADFDEEEFVAYLKANPDMADEDIESVIRKLEAVDGTEAAAELGAEDKASAPIRDVSLDIENLDTAGASVDIDAVDMASDVVQGVLDLCWQVAVGNYNAVVGVKDFASDVVNNIVTAVGGLVAGVWEFTVSAFASGADVISTLKDNVSGLVAGVWEFTVSAFTEGADLVSGLKGNVDGLVSKTIEVLANVAGSDLVQGLKINIAGLVGKTVEAIANVFGGQPLQSLKNSIASFVGKTVEAIANVFGAQPLQGLKNSIASFVGKTVNAVANVLGRGAVQSLRNTISGLIGKTVNAIANTFGKGAVDNLKNAIANLKDRTVNVITKFFNSNSEGSFRPGSGRVFANGGFVPASVSRFATGGTRFMGTGSRSAQIRYPQGPNMTIWNEGHGKGNTAGESFIPHAKSKRTRSTRILGLTAREFGLSVVRYDQGGVTHVGGVAPVGAGVAPVAAGSGVSARSVARGVASGLSGAQLSIGRSGEVSFALAAERGYSRLGRR